MSNKYAEMFQNSANAQLAPRSMQIDEQMQSLSMAVDLLEELMGELAMRLIPVTGEARISPETACPPMPLMVPLAGRISGYQNRVNGCNAEIRRLLTQLEL